MAVCAVAFPPPGRRWRIALTVGRPDLALALTVAEALTRLRYPCAQLQIGHRLKVDLRDGAERQPMTDRTPSRPWRRRVVVLALRAVAHSSSLSSASACSNQNPMSISRYIVVAVVRCSWAC